MSTRKLSYGILAILQFIAFHSFSQCLVPSAEGDTTWPVIDRLKTMAPFSYQHSNTGDRKFITAFTEAGNQFYVGGDFSYIGPNTGTGVLMDAEASRVTSFKKWRINGPVYASVPDGAGGYYIGGDFTRVGDSARINVAHINNQGVPTGWNPEVNDYVKAIALKNDTLIIGGAFTRVNGQTRNSFAMLRRDVNLLLPTTAVSSQVEPGRAIRAFALVDSVLYVGGEGNLSNSLDGLFKVHLPSGRPSALPPVFVMEDVFALAVSGDKKRLYIGGHGGMPYNQSSNGYCMDLVNGSLLFTIGVNISVPPPELSNDGQAEIYSIKVHGSKVYVGGKFNVGSVRGVPFSQNGIVVFSDATGQIESTLNNCDGFVTSIHAYENKVYVGGEFTSLGGQPRINFAVMDTLTRTMLPDTKSFSDQVRTVSFQNGSLFVGGEFYSVDGVRRDGLASFNRTTGEISSWVPNVYFLELNDMKARGDTIFMAGDFGPKGMSGSLGGLVAINGVTGAYYPARFEVPYAANDLLIEGDNLYVGSRDVVKINIPTLNPYNWKPNVGFDVKSLQKDGDKIYATGDNHRYVNWGRKGYVAEVSDRTGQKLRVFDLNPNDTREEDLDWITASALVGHKLFVAGNFSKFMGVVRTNFAAIDLRDGSVAPTHLRLTGPGDAADMKVLNGNLYIAGNFTHVNDQLHKYLVVVDTSLGIPYPDRLRLHTYDPVARNPGDDYEYPYYVRLNTIQVSASELILGGSFRNVDARMFPSLARLPITAIGSTTLPRPQINGNSFLDLPSTGNSFSVASPDLSVRYAWIYSGRDVVIHENGYSSVRLDIGREASPGQLKVVAISECGRSDTAYLDIQLRTAEPLTSATGLAVVRKTDTTATIKFTRGDGVGRIVLVKRSATLTTLPADGIDYGASARFGMGSDAGDSSFVVYRGSGDSVDLVNLSPATTYAVSVFEFNGSAGAINYRTEAAPVTSFSTYAVLPNRQATNIVFRNRTPTSLTIDCTPGNGEKRLVVIRKAMSIAGLPADGQVYSSQPVYGAGDDLGNQSFVVSNSATPVTITGLEPYTRYYISVMEFNGDGASAKYLLWNRPEAWTYTAAVEPTVQARDIVVTPTSGTTVTISCTPGNGRGRLVVVREGNPVVDAPADGVAYKWDTWLGSGANLGNQSYVVRDFTPTTVQFLKSGVTYHVTLYEFNGADTLTDYLVPGAPSTSFMIPVTTPTAQAWGLFVYDIGYTSARIGFNSGNGQGSLIVVRKDQPVVDLPQDGKFYAPSYKFGEGGDIGNGSYAVERLMATENLVPGATYYVKVFEYNGSGSSTKYLLANAPATSFTTLASPYTVISNFAGALNGSSVVLTWNTEKEVGNKEFVIERSGDANSYSPIAVVASRATNGSSTTPISYSFTDAAPLSKNFYRLKQVDANGQFRYSPIILVTTFSYGAEAPVVSNMSGCGASFSAVVRTVQEAATAIAFEYGTSSFSSQVTAAPGTVDNQTSTVQAAVSGLLPGFTYKVRLKFSFDGAWRYSAETVFTMPAQATPAVTASGPLSFCTGGSVQLTTAPVTGAGYQWQKDGTAIGGATGNSFTATTTGVYRVVVSTGSGCSVSSGPVTVAVNAVPAPPTVSATGPLQVCPGGEVVLASSASGGNQWYRDGIAISGATGAVYRASAGGTYTVVQTSGACTSPSSAGLTVTIKPLPAATVSAEGSTIVCEGNSVVLTAAPVSGATYQWQKNGASITGATAATYTAASSGTYSVMVTADGCSAASTGVNVTVNPLPAKPVITQSGNTLSSSAAGGNQWFLNGALIPGATGQQYTAQAGGQYTVQLTQNGCSSTSDAISFVATGLVDPVAWNNEVTVFPNPVADRLFIRNARERKLLIQLLDTRGTLVHQSRLSSLSGSVPMQTLTGGVYILMVTDVNKEETVIKTIVKQ